MLAIEKIHMKLINDVGVIQNKSILDYGCGQGALIEAIYKQDFSPKFIYAVDSNVKSIHNVTAKYQEQINQKKIKVQIASNPIEIKNSTFDKIICHNVIECINDKEQFVNSLYNLLNSNGTLIISHHDFDSAIYNSNQPEFTRSLIHFFADTGESWQTICDGQVGRKLPGILKKTGIENISFETWRVVEMSFNTFDYSYLLAKMILKVAQGKFDQDLLNKWFEGLRLKSEADNFYFAIDIVIAKAIKS